MTANLCWHDFVLIFIAMRKIYKSKVALAFVLPLIVLILLSSFLLIKTLWLPAVITIIFIGLYIHLYLTTYYELTPDKKLKVQSGFIFKKEIYINSIYRIRKAKSRSASPALSNDRLEIFYNRYGSLMVSPEHKTEFVEELQKVNPRITYDGITGANQQLVQPKTSSRLNPVIRPSHHRPRI